jgi:hypothetical protein
MALRVRLKHTQFDPVACIELIRRMALWGQLELTVCNKITVAVRLSAEWPIKADLNVGADLQVCTSVGLAGWLLETDQKA